MFVYNLMLPSDTGSGHNLLDPFCDAAVPVGTTQSNPAWQCIQVDNSFHVGLFCTKRHLHMPVCYCGCHAPNINVSGIVWLLRGHEMFSFDTSSQEVIAIFPNP